MAAAVLLHQPVRAVSAFDMPHASGENHHSRLVIDAGSAVLPALKVKYVPHLVTLSEFPYNKFTSADTRPGPVVFFGGSASFQDKFPRWSSSTFM